MPASRSVRAMIFAPRSWPSRPGFATTTRIRPLISQRVYPECAGANTTSSVRSSVIEWNRCSTPARDEHRVAGAHRMVGAVHLNPAATAQHVVDLVLAVGSLQVGFARRQRVGTGAERRHRQELLVALTRLQLAPRRSRCATTGRRAPSRHTVPTRRHPDLIGIVNDTVQPSPGALKTSHLPPARRIRSVIASKPHVQAQMGASQRGLDQIPAHRRGPTPRPIRPSAPDVPTRATRRNACGRSPSPPAPCGNTAPRPHRRIAGRESPPRS